MPIRKYSLAVPMTRQTGDEFRFVGKRIEQWVGAMKVDERDLSQEASVILEQPETFGAATVQSVYLEQPMATSKTCTGVSVGATGIVRFTFSDGSQPEVPSHADGVQLASDLDANASLAENLLIAKAYRHSPDGTSLDDIIGSTVTIDTSADTPIQYNPSVAMQ